MSGFRTRASTVLNHRGEGWEIQPCQVPAEAAYFCRPTTLPLTLGGRVDRAALPPPPAERDERQGASIPPRSAVEGALADVIAAVPGVERVGADVSFSGLGGHSLFATKIVARVPGRAAVKAPRLDIPGPAPGAARKVAAICGHAGRNDE